MQPKAKVIKIPYHLILLLLLGAACPAQSVKLEYLPKNGDSLKAFVSSLAAKKAKEFGPQYQKEIKNALEERREHFLKSIADSTFVYDSWLNVYLKSLLAKIYGANPEIPNKDFYFFIDRSPVPNAGCYGNGIFTINLGLFPLLETEGQLASVLCHEIAHHLLKHNDKSLLRHVETVNSANTKRKISQIKRQQYNQRQAIQELQKELGYNFMKRNRTAEMQADSLGLALLRKAGFPPSAVTSSLKKLKESDSMLFAVNTNIRIRFSFDDYPFKAGWLEPEAKLFDLKEAVDDLALNKDSLRSHPDIDKRINAMSFAGSAGLAGTDEGYAEVRKTAGTYMIRSALDAGHLDIALYQAMAMHETGTLDDHLYYLTIAQLLKNAYEFKSNHTFGKYVGTVSPFSEELYLNEVRLFLNRLELKNIRKIGHLFCRKYKDIMINTPEFEQLTAYFEALNPN